MAGVEQLRALARVIVAPQARDARREFLRGLVMAHAAESRSLKTIDAGTVQRFASERYGISGFPRKAYDDALAQMAKEGLLTPHGEGWNPAAGLLAKLPRVEQEFGETTRRMRTIYFSYVKRHFRDLDAYDEVMAAKFLDHGLVRILSALGDAVLKFYYGKDAKVLPDNTIDDLLKSAADSGFRSEDLKWACIRGLKEAFLSSEPAFAAGFQMYASRWTMLQLARQPRDILDVRDKLISETQLFLDSNILVSYFCEGSEFHAATKEAIDVTRGLKIRLCVFDETLLEFRKALEWAGTLVTESAPDLKAEDNEIIRTFRRIMSEAREWPTFARMLETALTAFLTEFQVASIPMAPYVAGTLQVSHARQLIRDQYAAKGRIKPAPWELVEHDARMLGAIQKLRHGKALGLGTCWFLTRQPSLVRPDQLYNDRHGTTDYPSTLSLETWFDVIGPFAALEREDGDGATTLSRLVGDAYLPILPALSLRDFVHFVGPTLGLTKGEEELLTVQIQNSPLAATLQRAINERDTIRSLELLQAVAAKIDAEKDARIAEQKATIARLVERTKARDREVVMENSEAGGIHIHAEGDIHAIIGSPGASQVLSDPQVMAQFADMLQAVLDKIPHEAGRVAEIQAAMKSPDETERKRGLKRCVAWLREHTDDVAEAAAVLGRIFVKTAGQAMSSS